MFGLWTFHHKTTRHIWIIGNGVLFFCWLFATGCANTLVLNNREAGHGPRIDGTGTVFGAARLLRIVAATGEKQFLLVIVLCDSSSISVVGGGGSVGCGTTSPLVE